MSLTLREFLLETHQQGYASEREDNKQRMKDGSTTITHISKDREWEMCDNYFGGNPFGGRKLIIHHYIPIWIMLYYGWVKQDQDHKEIYEFLRKALLQSPEGVPLRGPEGFEGDKLRYEAGWNGTIHRFHGREVIYSIPTSLTGQKVYEGHFSGGLINVR